MNTLILPCDVGDVSDGYHSFNELYEHRILLWLLVMKASKGAFKTLLSEDGVEMPGWFIAGLSTEFGQITYHIPARYWAALDVEILDRNAGYDNHTSGDVLERLASMLFK